MADIDKQESASIVDLKNAATKIILPKESAVITLGVSEDGALFCPEQGGESTAVAMLLCFIHCEEEGHWISPVSLDFPCLLNDLEIEEESLLSHGSVIKIGEHYLRYNDARVIRCRRILPLAEPPPKPRRVSAVVPVPNSQEEEEEDSEEEEGVYNKEDEKDENSENMMQMQGAQLDWVLVDIPTEEDELKQQMSTPDQVANIACSYLSHQLMLHTESAMSAADVDKLFKVFPEIAEMGEVTLRDFIKEYNDQLKLQAKMAGTPKVSKAIHSPLIKLLTELLRLSLDPIEHNVLWLRYLTYLVNIPQNLGSFVENKTAAVVMGTMAAHSDSAEIQMCATTILAQLARYRPLPNEKAPVRESGIELIVKSLRLYQHDVSVLRPATTAIANLTATISEATNQVVDAATTVDTVDQSEEIINKYLGLLDYVESQALPIIVETMNRNHDDELIQRQCRRTLSFYKTKSQQDAGTERGKKSGSARRKRPSKKKSRHTVGKAQVKPEMRKWQSMEVGLNEPAVEPTLTKWRSMGDVNKQPSILRRTGSTGNLDKKRVQFSMDTQGGLVSSSDSEDDFIHHIHKSKSFDAASEDQARVVNHQVLRELALKSRSMSVDTEQHKKGRQKFRKFHQPRPVYESLSSDSELDEILRINEGSRVPRHQLDEDVLNKVVFNIGNDDSPAQNRTTDSGLYKDDSDSNEETIPGVGTFSVLPDIVQLSYRKLEDFGEIPKPDVEDVDTSADTSATATNNIPINGNTDMETNVNIGNNSDCDSVIDAQRTGVLNTSEVSSGNHMDTGHQLSDDIKANDFPTDGEDVKLNQDMHHTYSDAAYDGREEQGDSILNPMDAANTAPFQTSTPIKAIPEQRDSPSHFNVSLDISYDPESSGGHPVGESTRTAEDGAVKVDDAVSIPAAGERLRSRGSFVDAFVKHWEAKIEESETLANEEGGSGAVPRLRSSSSEDSISSGPLSPAPKTNVNNQGPVSPSLLSPTTRRRWGGIEKPNVEDLVDLRRKTSATESEYSASEMENSVEIKQPPPKPAPRDSRPIPKPRSSSLKRKKDPAPPPHPQQIHTSDNSVGKSYQQNRIDGNKKIDSRIPQEDGISDIPVVSPGHQVAAPVDGNSVTKETINNIFPGQQVAAQTESNDVTMETINDVLPSQQVAAKTENNDVSEETKNDVSPGQQVAVQIKNNDVFPDQQVAAQAEDSGIIEDTISDEHPLVSQTIELRTLLANYILALWQSGEQNLAVETLTTPVRLVLEAVGVVEVPDILAELPPEHNLVLADPALVVNIVQAIQESSYETGIPSKIIRSVEGLLDISQHPSHVSAICSCLQGLLEGPLAEDISGGWGHFMMRKLQIKTLSVLSKTQSTDSSSDSLLSLHSRLAQLLGENER